jgi:hypothetical protein
MAGPEPVRTNRSAWTIVAESLTNTISVSAPCDGKITVSNAPAEVAGSVTGPEHPATQRARAIMNVLMLA